MFESFVSIIFFCQKTIFIFFDNKVEILHNNANITAFCKLAQELVMGHFYGLLLWVTSMGHFYGSLLWVTSMGHFNLFVLFLIDKVFIV